jgi:hypothetical protein
MRELNKHLPRRGQASDSVSKDVVTFLCLLWLIGSCIGFAVNAWAAPSSGLRGHKMQDDPPLAAPKSAESRAAQTWLSAAVWRAGPCSQTQNFQRFEFGKIPVVEVGNGGPGDGERLELLGVGEASAGYIQVHTRVCAPVGCNQTREVYKKLDRNRMQEWHFEGRLPGHTPYVLVDKGVATDGSGPGRIFTRCQK